MEMKLELFYEVSNKTRKNVFTTIKIDAKNKRIYLGQKDSILILNEDLSTNYTIEHAHDLNVNYLDVNTNKNHQILSTANECFLKFWDIRNTKFPNLIIQDS